MQRTGSFVTLKSASTTAVDLYRFTSVLCAQLDQDGRKQIIEMLWEIAMADRVVHGSGRTSSGEWPSCLGLGPRSRAVERKTVAKPARPEVRERAG